MGESTRPSMQAVQRTLIIGLLAGLILGCAVGAGLVWLYIQQERIVYQGGAFPDELSEAYQNHYLAMVVDSYIINQEPEVAKDRLKAFGPSTQIQILADRSAAYVAAGRGAEAQFINLLAASLKESEQWNDDTIRQVVGGLSEKYQTDPARSQAISTFSEQLLNREVPATATPIATGEETAPPEPAGAPEPERTDVGGISQLQLTILLSCLVLIILGVAIYWIGRRQFEKRKAPVKQKIEWKGAGQPPIRQWSGTYTFGHDSYDEFFTIETDEGDFLGESGMGILDFVPDTKPRQVVSFDVGLFDKTDITTLSRVVMSEYAYGDEAFRTKVDSNPQAEAILAEPDKEFMFETSALQVVARIEEVEYGEGGSIYFEKLKVSMDLFLKEGVDLKPGEMEIPEEYQ